MSTGLRFTLDVDGLPPDAFAVVSFHLSQSYSSLFTLDISLVSQQLHSIEFSQILEKMAYLKIWQGDEIQRRVTLCWGRRYCRAKRILRYRGRYQSYFRVPTAAIRPGRPHLWEYSARAGKHRRIFICKYAMRN